MSLLRISLVLVLSVLAACATVSTSELVSVSRDPGMKDVSYSHFYVMALAADPARRRMIEDTVAARLRDTGVQAEVSYTSLPDLDLDDEAALRSAAEKAVEESGADAVLVGKMVSESRRTEYTAPRVEQTPVPAAPYYMGFGNYVGYGYQTVIMPGEVREIREFFLQTSVYDVSSGKPAWRAQSRTLNPDNLAEAVNDVADMLATRLSQDGLLEGVGVAPLERSQGY